MNTNRCFWCNKRIKENQPVYGFGAKVWPSVDLSGQEGTIIKLWLTQAGREVLAGVAASDSDAKREGYDLVFMTCSERCGHELRAALREEIGQEPI